MLETKNLEKILNTAKRNVSKRQVERIQAEESVVEETVTVKKKKKRPSEE